MSGTKVWLPGAMVARLASIADGTKRLQVRVLRWSCFWVFKVNINVFPLCTVSSFLGWVGEGGRLPLMGCSDIMLAYKYGRLAKWHRVWLRIRRLQVRPLRWSSSLFSMASLGYLWSSCSVHLVSDLPVCNYNHLHIQRCRLLQRIRQPFSHC